MLKKTKPQIYVYERFDIYFNWIGTVIWCACSAFHKQRVKFIFNHSIAYLVMLIQVVFIMVVASVYLLPFGIWNLRFFSTFNSLCVFFCSFSPHNQNETRSFKFTFYWTSLPGAYNARFWSMQFSVRSILVYIFNIKWLILSWHFR